MQAALRRLRQTDAECMEAEVTRAAEERVREAVAKERQHQAAVLEVMCGSTTPRVCAQYFDMCFIRLLRLL